MTRRTERLNSLLREVLSEVIRDDIRNPDVSSLSSITEVDITTDLHHAKVYVSVIGTHQERDKTVAALNTAAGYIGTVASKMVRMRFFPHLKFLADTTVDKQMAIDKALRDIKDNQKTELL